jgi:hypothetical protein
MKNLGNFGAGTSAGTAGTDIDAYTYLRQVWNDQLQPIPIRLRAAAIGIEFERPRLQMTAMVSNEQDFATLLDRRLKRIAELEANGNRPQQIIEHQPQPRPLATTNDRRFRRM